MIKLFTGVLLGVLSLLETSAVYATSTATLSTLTPSVRVGSQISFNININFTGNPILGGGLDVIYTGFTDLNQLTFVSYTPADNIGLDPDFGRTPDQLSNKLNGIGFTADTSNASSPAYSGLSGPVSIGKLVFTANTVGHYSLDLAINTADVGGFFDIHNAPLAGVGLLGTSFDVTPAAVVPLPGSSWLFIGALTGLFGFIKRQRRSASNII